MVVPPCEINIRRCLIAECCKLFELELPQILIDSADTDICRQFPVDYAQLQKRIVRSVSLNSHEFSYRAGTFKSIASEWGRNKCFIVVMQCSDWDRSAVVRFRCRN